MVIKLGIILLAILQFCLLCSQILFILKIVFDLMYMTLQISNISHQLSA